MKTKWKHIYSAAYVKDGIKIQYECFYENAFGVLYRSVTPMKNATYFGNSARSIEYLEIVMDKNRAVEKCVEYWKEEMNNYWERGKIDLYKVMGKS